jgi:hypothetical protein
MAGSIQFTRIERGYVILNALKASGNPLGPVGISETEFGGSERFSV